LPLPLLYAPFPGTTAWQFNVTDGSQYGIGWVTLTVPPGAPLALPDAYACPFNASCAVLAVAGLLANDSSPNLNAVLAAAPGGAALALVDCGLLALGADGAFNFTPAE
jgi:hypothetical protein